MTFWQKLKRPKDPVRTLSDSGKQGEGKQASTNDQTTTATNCASLEVRTIIGLPVQRQLDPPAPYTTHPHITHYSPDLVISGTHTVCRCILPIAHGDAFTRRHHAEVANGITFLSPSGQPITWEQAAHGFLDALGVDSRVSPGWHMEHEALLQQVFHENTVRAIKRYHEVWKGVKRHGQLKCALEDDVFWWDTVNPKDVAVRKISGGSTASGEVLTVNGPFYGGTDDTKDKQKQKGKEKWKRRGMFFM